MNIQINPEDLHGAEFVHWDERHQVLFVWHGGHTVNLFSPEGHNFDCFTCGDYAHNAVSIEEVQENIEKHFNYEDGV